MPSPRGGVGHDFFAHELLRWILRAAQFRVKLPRRLRKQRLTVRAHQLGSPLAFLKGLGDLRLLRLLPLRLRLLLPLLRPRPQHADDVLGLLQGIRVPFVME